MEARKKADRACEVHAAAANARNKLKELAEKNPLLFFVDGNEVRLNAAEAPASRGKEKINRLHSQSKPQIQGKSKCLCY